MKKFMLLIVLVALLSGCATQNPHFKNLQVFGGTVVGAAGGYKAAGLIGGVLGAVVGHEVVKGTQWWASGYDDADVVYVNASGYSGYGHVRCDRVPSQGMAPYAHGMCRDPRSGGQVSYEELQRRSHSQGDYYQPSRASYVHPQTVSYPQNMWERPDRKK